MIELYYKNWLTQKGKPVPIKKIEFLDYLQENKHIKVFIHNDVKYHGEKWKCLKRGKYETLIFREEVVDSYDKEDVGWGYTSLKNVINDITPNILMDSYESVIAYQRQEINGFLIRRDGKIVNYSANEQLNKFSEHDDQILIQLKKDCRAEKDPIIKNYLQARINFRENPCIHTLKLLKNANLQRIKSNKENVSLPNN